MLKNAYITVNLTPIDKDKLQQYVAAVPATLAKYSGEFLVKGIFEKLSGNTDYEMQVILVFPTKEQATGWYYSPEYQALIPLRCLDALAIPIDRHIKSITS